MIWTIARREFFEYLKSLRFVVGLLITIALTAISTFINVGDFTQRTAEYESARAEMSGDGVKVRIFRHPEPLGSLVLGIERRVGSQAEMTGWHIPSSTTGYMEEYASLHHRFVSGFSALDFAFVVKITLSLMVIFLAFSAIAGDRAGGTLRLAISNPVPRYALLLGKTVGGLMFILATLSVAMLVSLIILIGHPSVVLEPSDWLRIAGIYGVSALYLTTFFMLSILVSVIVSHPSTALLILLQAWVFFVIIYPVAANVVAENWYSLPGDEELEEREHAALQPFEKETEEINEAFKRSWSNGKPASVQLRVRNDEHNAKTAQVSHQVDLELLSLQRRQRSMAESLTMLSPAALYDQAVMRMARTSFDAYDRFLESIGRYWKEFVTYSRRKIEDPEGAKRAALPGFTDPREATAESLDAAGAQMAAMMCLGALFFAGAYFAFLRMDVR